jgi:hypothetical protein
MISPQQYSQNQRSGREYNARYLGLLAHYGLEPAIIGVAERCRPSFSVYARPSLQKRERMKSAQSYEQSAAGPQSSQMHDSSKIQECNVAGYFRKREAD